METGSHNVGPPSQMQSQFAGAPTVGPWPAPPVPPSQFPDLQPQQGAFNHTQLPFRSNLGHPQGNIYADSNALNIANRQLHTNIMNIPSSSPGWNRPDMVPTTGNDRNQNSQPRQQPPQVVLRSDPNSGVGANMQRNYASSFGPGTLSLPSPRVAVTEGDQFSPSFQSPRHDNLRMGTSDQSGGLLSNSPAHQIEYSSTLNFTLPPPTSHHSANQQALYPHISAMQDFQNMQLPTYLSIPNPTPPTVHEDSRLPNVSGILTGLTPHSDPNSGVGATLERNYPYSFGHGMPSSLSSPVAVTQGRFNPIIQRQNPAPTINAPVNEDSRLANVSATFRGLTQPSQFQAATRINSQEDINLVEGESHNDNEMLNSDLPLIFNPYMYGSTSGRD